MPQGLGDGDGDGDGDGGGSSDGLGAGLGAVVGELAPPCVGELVDAWVLPSESELSAARSTGSAELVELGSGSAVEPLTTGPLPPATLGSVAEAVSVAGASPRVNVRTAAATIVTMTAPEMMRGSGLLNTGLLVRLGGWECAGSA